MERETPQGLLESTQKVTTLLKMTGPVHCRDLLPLGGYARWRTESEWRDQVLKQHVSPQPLLYRGPPPQTGKEILKEY